MGPYCKFCNNRCFTPIPAGTPDRIVKVFNCDIIATCAAGQEFEKKKIGYCYADVKPFKASTGGG